MEIKKKKKRRRKMKKGMAEIRKESKGKRILTLRYPRA